MKTKPNEKTNAEENTGFLKRFTKLDALFDMLTEKRLVFSDPSKWEDKNDSAVLEAYRESLGKKRVRVLCFCNEGESIHHWNSYATGMDGCCIEFDAGKLIKQFAKHNIIHGYICYKQVAELYSKSPRKQLFIKRWPYQVDKEYRAIVTDDSDAPDFGIPIDIGIIRKITISQRMKKPLFEHVKKCLQEIFFAAGANVRVSHSYILENPDLIKKIKTAGKSRNKEK